MNSSIEFKGCLPTFIIIGAMKAGTTSLHHYLSLHPDIQMSGQKELDFFVPSLNWKRGIDWYMKHFNPKFIHRGESSPNYSKWPTTAPLMHANLPDVRLIYIIRNPVERFLSHCNHQNIDPNKLALKIPGKNDIEKSILATGEYYRQIERYLSLYPRERILVLTFEDLKSDINGLLKKIFAFLGADSDKYPWRSADFSPKHESRNKLTVRRNAIELRNISFIQNLKNVLLKIPLLSSFLKIAIRNLLYRRRKLYSLDAQNVEVIFNFYRNDLQAMEKFTGLPLLKMYGSEY